MKNISLAGSIVALVTPFIGGGIDYEALAKLIEFHIARGTKGIVVCGTTGESATLSHGEHVKIIYHAVRVSAGRIPIIAGTGSNSTAEAISLTKAAKKYGANGALLISPYYNRPSQEGLYQHYRAVSESVDLPLVLYSIRSRTGVNIEAETVARLARLKNIIGIKEASGDLAQMTEIMALTGGMFQLTSGDDALTLPVLSIGGVGVISVLANIVPEETQAVVDAFQQKKNPVAAVLNRKLIRLTKAMFMETNPVPVKTALGMMGMIDPEVRLPLCPMSDANATRLRQELQSAGLIKVP